jgi:hypothetical protein
MHRTAAPAILSAVLAIATAPAYPQGGADGGGDARNRGYGFLMIEEPVNPRNISMGSAGTALGGPGFRYYNPVSPFFSAAPYASAEFGQMPGGVNKGGFESALAYPRWFAAVSFYSNSVDYETRDERGMGAPAKSGTAFGALGAGFVRENLAVGISANMAEDRIWVSSSYSAVALGAGIGYKTLGGKLSLGAAMFHNVAWSRGFGEDVLQWGDGRVPRFTRAGAAWADELMSLPYTAAADIVYRDENGTFSVPVGVDVKILPYLSLRLGKRIGWESEIKSFGIGLNIDKISFDAAFVPTVFVDDYEMKWGMAFTYSLGGKRKIKMPPALITPGDGEDDEETIEDEKVEEGAEDAEEKAGEEEKTGETELPPPSEESEPRTSEDTAADTAIDAEQPEPLKQSDEPTEPTPESMDDPEDKPAEPSESLDESESQ